MSRPRSIPLLGPAVGKYPPVVAASPDGAGRRNWTSSRRPRI
ncbi:hypothetical protein LF41_2098 [Lysobacter dokdonensis DS-58]|uniref:Uncharacterized protein n=1 Tax=Lysobacter dokdonensis DS-58 TaxID=1300345 RepID=A0A0A2X4K8_9GAMM|nr:hypothetical protein LF41_2098 [Lysobacter dokdonensis DS-58]